MENTSLSLVALGTVLLEQYGIPSTLLDIPRNPKAMAGVPAIEVPSGSKRRLVTFQSDAERNRADDLVRPITAPGASARKVDKRAKNLWTPSPIQHWAGKGWWDDEGVLNIPLHPEENTAPEDQWVLRIKHQPSPSNINDGFGAAAKPAVITLVALALKAQGMDGRAALEEARRAVHSARYFQHFSLGNAAGTKGLTSLTGRREFEAAYGKGIDMILDAENIKMEALLSLPHTGIRGYLRRPFDRGKATPIAQVTELGVGWDWRQMLGTQEMGRVAEELIRRATRDLAAALQADTPEAIDLNTLVVDDMGDMPNYGGREESAYAQTAERALSLKWVGTIYTESKGQRPSTLGDLKVKDPDGSGAKMTRGRAITSALGGYLVGDGLYMGLPCPTKGFIVPVIEQGKVVGWAMHPDTMVKHFNHWDTPDSDGDYVLVALRYIEGKKAYYAEVCRFPQSPGGGALVRMRKADWEWLRDVKGLIPSPVTGARPYGHFPEEGVYTLLPQEDGADEANIGGIYNLVSVLKILGRLDQPVSSAFRKAMTTLGYDIPLSVIHLSEATRTY